jgi:ABC-type sugar transport system ATPase subunit
VPIHGSDVVILDEPAAELGIQEPNRVLALIEDLRSADKSIVLISHNLQQVWSVSDRFMVLRLGKVAGIREREQTTADEIVRLIGYGEQEAG